MDQPGLTRQRARELRKNPTKEERHLWYDFLKTYPVQFRRQVPFGPYIVDFYCEKARLAIELDGGQHYEPAGLDYDRRRAAYLEGTHRLVLLRIPNSDIQRHFEAVCVQIDQKIKNV